MTPWIQLLGLQIHHRDSRYLEIKVHSQSNVDSNCLREIAKETWLWLSLELIINLPVVIICYKQQYSVPLSQSLFKMVFLMRSYLYLNKHIILSVINPLRQCTSGHKNYNFCIRWIFLRKGFISIQTKALKPQEVNCSSCSSCSLFQVNGFSFKARQSFLKLFSVAS